MRMNVTILTVVLLVLLTGSAYGLELHGSHLYTLERSDAGDLFASAAIVLDLEITESIGFVLVHEQALEGHTALTNRATTWDLSVVWRTSPAMSVSIGRRWIDRRWEPPDSNVWTYIQIWQGL